MPYCNFQLIGQLAEMAKREWRRVAGAQRGEQGKGEACCDWGKASRENWGRNRNRAGSLVSHFLAFSPCPCQSPFADVTSRRKYASDFFLLLPPRPVHSVPSLFRTETALNGVKRSSVWQDTLSFSFLLSFYCKYLPFCFVFSPVAVLEWAWWNKVGF